MANHEHISVPANKIIPSIFRCFWPKMSAYPTPSERYQYRTTVPILRELGAGKGTGIVQYG